MTKSDLLTAEQEAALGRRVRAWLDDGGDEADGIAARNELVDRNYYLVPYVISIHFRLSRSQWPDADQEGYLGLMKAAEKFDPSFGTKFSTYAAWWIYQYVQKHLFCDRIVYVPYHFAGEKGEKNFSGSRHYHKAKQATRRVASLDVAPRESGWDPTSGPAPDNSTEDYRLLIRRLLREARVSDNQADSILSFYGIGREPENNTEIADRLGYKDRRGASQARTEGLIKVREAVRCNSALRAKVEDVLGKVAI